MIFTRKNLWFQMTKGATASRLASWSKNCSEFSGKTTENRRSQIASLFQSSRKSLKVLKFKFSGTGTKFMKNSPKHLFDAEDLEPLYTPQVNILEECLRREAERVAH